MEAVGEKKTLITLAWSKVTATSRVLVLTIFTLPREESEGSVTCERTKNELSLAVLRVPQRPVERARDPISIVGGSAST